MTKKLSIGEAIAHSDQIVDSYRNTAPDCDCVQEHRQLSKWLRELKGLQGCKKELTRLKRQQRELKGLLVQVVKYTKDVDYGVSNSVLVKFSSNKDLAIWLHKVREIAYEDLF